MTAVESIQQSLPNNKTAALVRTFENRLYLTGMATSDGFVLITKNKAWFLTDFRFIEAAQKQVNTMESVLCQRLSETATPLLESAGITHILLEQSGTTLAELMTLKRVFPVITFVEDNTLDATIVALRRIKTPLQMAKIREAQRLTDEGFSYILSRIEAGRTEKEIALDLEFQMRKAGADSVSFEFVGVAGENSSLPHGVPSDRVIRRGDFVTMDFGATVDGWHSDMTRTIAVGTVDEEQKKVYDIVLQAQLAALDGIKAGVSCADADRFAREIIDNAGYGPCFGHSTGHGVGVEIHEYPNLFSRSTEVLQVGNVVTVEPGIYLAGKWGVRIEDMVFVTQDGCENITNSPKNLIIL